MALGKIEIQPPLAGLDGRLSYQQQAPFTTPDAKNVRPRGTSEFRNRLGSRPGMDRAFYEELPGGAGVPIRMLNEVTVVGNSGLSIWEDTFDGETLGEMWSQGSSSDILNIPGDTPGGLGNAKYVDPRGFAAVDAGEYGGLIRATFNINTDQDYGAEIYISPHRGVHPATTEYMIYRILTRLNNANPDISDAGWFLELKLSNSGAYAWRIVEVHSAGTVVVQTSGTGNNGWCAPGWLKFHHLNGGNIYASWRSDVLLNAAPPMTLHATPAGNKVAFSIDARNATLHTVGLVDTFRIRRYLTTQTSARNRILIASAGGLAYRETPLGLMQKKTSSSATLASDRTLESAEHLQKLYIADIGEPLIDSATGVINTATTQPRDLTDPNVPKFTDVTAWTAANASYTVGSIVKPTSDNGRAYICTSEAGTGTSGATEPAWPTTIGTTVTDNPGANQLVWTCAESTLLSSSVITSDYVVEIYGCSDPTLIGTWTVNSLVTTSAPDDTLRLDTGRFPGSAATVSGISYRVWRGPKVYTPNVTPASDTLTLWVADAGKGTIPSGCALLTMWRDRIVLSGYRPAPHLWFMSRAGDPLDWDFGLLADDPGRAVAGQDSDAGTIGQPVRALIPMSDDYLLFGCVSSLWIMRGDPAQDGRIDNLSRAIGVVSARAWARGPDSEVYILSRDGLYLIAPGGQAAPVALSPVRLPNELRDIDQPSLNVSLAYDTRARGVHIFVVHDAIGESAAAAQGYGIGRRHWFYDIQQQAYWPVITPSNFEPTIMHEYVGSTDSDTAVLLGCRDGMIRKFDQRHDRDESNAIDSYVLIGPINMGGTDQDGILTEISALLGGNSSDVTWSLFVGDGAESAYRADAFGISGTWQHDVNIRSHPRARGGSVFIKIAKSGNYPWIVEKIYATIAAAGRQRFLSRPRASL